jgi:prepilin-type N-terminal cleavage/methylation domain-containing protein
MHPPRPKPRNRGMSLFEVIIALGVFGIAALALVQTMHVMGETTLEARTIREVTQGLESIIDEYGKVPALQELDEEIKAEKTGVTYQVLIRPLEGLRNKEGRELQGFFTIRAIAKWKSNGQPMELQAETIRFVNAFVPIGG